MQDIYLEKARKTHRGHSDWYTSTLGANHPSTGKAYTGDFGKDYNCSVEDLAKAFEDENCPVCGRSYASIAEGKTGVAANPSYYKTWHIWFPDWIVVCRSCHSEIEGKPAVEWKLCTLL